MYTIRVPDDVFEKFSEHIHGQKINKRIEIDSMIGDNQNMDQVPKWLVELMTNELELWRKIDYCVSTAEHSEGEVEIPPRVPTPEILDRLIELIKNA